MRTFVDAGSLPRSDVDLQSVVGEAHPLGQPLAGFGVAPDLVGEMREVGAPYAQAVCEVDSVAHQLMGVVGRIPAQRIDYERVNVLYIRYFCLVDRPMRNPRMGILSWSTTMGTILRSPICSGSCGAMVWRASLGTPG